MFRPAFLAVALVAAPVASAQTTPAPAPATQGLGGPAIPGLCLLSREAIYANAAIGKAATVRLKQLADQAQGEIEAERKPIDADLRAFQAEAAKLTPAQRGARDEALAARLRPLQAKAQLRGREIEATRLKAMRRISEEVQPLIASVYQQRKCGLLVDRNSVLGGNLANDLTADVVRLLDAKLTTITFEREILPAETGANR
jgi:Skp family chaperone for outer membrane proteins